MTVPTSTPKGFDELAKTGSPSIGGVPLEVEKSEIEVSKSRSGNFSLGPRKIFMTLWNLKAFILIIWGFHSMIAATIQSAGMAKFSTFVNPNVMNTYSGCPAITLSYINSDYQDTECFNMKQSKDDMQKHGMPSFLLFLFFNLAWMLWICIQSNMLWYRTDELGFHVCWVEIRKKFSYKIWAAVDCFICVCVLLYGISKLSTELEPEAFNRVLAVMMNGFFQVFLGVWDLYSPLEETLSFGEGAMVSPMKCSMFTEAGKAINQYQDAMLAALARGKTDLTWMEKATGATKEDCEQVLFEISAKQHPSNDEKKNFNFC